LHKIGGGIKNFKILDEENYYYALRGYDIVLPTPETGAFEHETVLEQYANIHNRKDIMLVRDIIQAQDAQYIPYFDATMNAHAAYIYNMFCTYKATFDAYCEWLFPILFELERHIDYKNRESYQRRVFGFISERLLNVWVRKNHLRVREVNVISIDEHKFKRWIQKMVFGS